MSAPRFVTLPSGRRVNLSRIFEIITNSDGTLRIYSSTRDFDGTKYDAVDAAALISVIDSLGQPSAVPWEFDACSLADALREDYAAAGLGEIVSDKTVDYRAWATRLHERMRAAAVARRGR
jgi:hypothetical protein